MLVRVQVQFLVLGVDIIMDFADSRIKIWKPWALQYILNLPLFLFKIFRNLDLQQNEDKMMTFKSI